MPNAVHRKKKPNVSQKVGGANEDATASQFQAFLKVLQHFFPHINMREKSVKP